MKVVVDAFGGDNAPKEIVKGVISAVNNIKELKVILTGKNRILKMCWQRKIITVTALK